MKNLKGGLSLLPSAFLTACRKGLSPLGVSPDFVLPTVGRGQRERGQTRAGWDQRKLGIGLELSTSHAILSDFTILLLPCLLWEGEQQAGMVEGFGGRLLGGVPSHHTGYPEQWPPF